MGLFDFLKPKTPVSLDSLFNGEKIFVIANAGLQVLENSYRKLDNKGKFEVLLFNGTYLLSIFKQKKPEYYDDAEFDFNVILFNKQKN